MTGSGDIDFAAIAPDVARALWGAENTGLSNKTELRFGRHGSVSVPLTGTKRGSFFDHEAGVGGGVLDMVRHKAGLANGAAMTWLRERGFIEARRDDAKQSRRIVATYVYTDAAGTPLYRKVRFHPKTFVFERADGRGGWIGGKGAMNGAEWVLYRLSEMLRAPASTTVYLCEGEKAADALADRMLIAIAAGGAKAWRPGFAQHLRGRRVCLLPDNDAAGVTYAETAAHSLLGIAASVTVLPLPGLAPGADVVDWLAAGGTEEELEELADQTTPEEAAEAQDDPNSEQLTFGRLSLVKPEQCVTLDGREYLLKGLIGRGDHAIVIGQPGAGKSVLGPHIAYAIAQGRSIFGRRVRTSRVLYAAAEDGHGMRRRVAALRRRWGDAPAFYLLPQAIDLLSPDSGDRDSLLNAVATLMPDIVVFDTVSRAFPGLAENDSEGMGHVVQFVRTITADGKRAVLTAHHVTKDGGGTPRGHGVLAADVDVVLLVEGSGADARTVRVTKNRNGPSDATLSFAIETELLGVDEDGDPITAPIATETETAAIDELRGREAALKDAPLRMLREVRTALAEGAVERVAPAPEMPPQDCIARGLLRARLIASGWFDEGLLRTAPSGGAELLRAGYKPENRELTSLSRKGFLAFNRHWVWLL